MIQNDAKIVYPSLDSPNFKQKLMAMDWFRMNKIEYFMHNQMFISAFIHPRTPYRSLLAVYEVGTGKTFASCECIYNFISDKKRVIYTTKSLTTIDNFIRILGEYEKVSSKIIDRKMLQIMTGMKFRNYKSECDLLIIDEAHNYIDNSTSGIIGDYLKEKKDVRVLMLTATPLINKVEDLNSILSLAPCPFTGITPIAYFDMLPIQKSIKLIYEGEHFIDVKECCIMKKNQTEISDNSIVCVSEMSKMQSDNYYDLINKKRNDMNYSLDIALLMFAKNDIYESSKISKLIYELEKNKNELTIVFCQYVEKGVGIIRKYLETKSEYKMLKDIYRKDEMILMGKSKRFIVITGNTKCKLELINMFHCVENRYGEYVRFLLCSNVLNEGIDIYNVRQIHILTPHWNFSVEHQMCGRVIRPSSHAVFTDVNDKYIRIYRHVCNIGDINIDINKYVLSLKKRNKINKCLEKIKDLSVLDTQKIKYLIETNIYDQDNFATMIENEIKRKIKINDEIESKYRFLFKGKNIFVRSLIKYNSDNNNITPDDGTYVTQSINDMKIRFTVFKDKKRIKNVLLDRMSKDEIHENALNLSIEIDKKDKKIIIVELIDEMLKRDRFIYWQ